MNMTSARPPQQDKQKEVAFFDGHAAADAYDVFTPESNMRLTDAFKRLSDLPAGSRVADLGCGSGVFTNLLHQARYNCIGLDLSTKLIGIARAKFPEVEFFEGDVEHLPFATKSLDGILLSGLVHHLPDPSRCAAHQPRAADLTIVGGAGHVGVPFVLTFAAKGFQVNVNDINPDTLATLKAGRLPFIGYGAEPLLTKALAEKRLIFTSNPSDISPNAPVIVMIGNRWMSFSTQCAASSRSASTG
jgi:SAM-dependent methyltransferase